MFECVCRRHYKDMPSNWHISNTALKTGAGDDTQSRDRQKGGQSGVPVPVWATGLLCFPKRTDQLWGPPSPLVNGYRGPFPAVKRPGLDAHPPPSGAFTGRAETGGDTVRSSRVEWTVDDSRCQGNKAQPTSRAHSTHFHGIWLDKRYKIPSPIW